MYFNTQKTFSRDLELFEELGFTPFEIDTHKDHYVGTFNYKDGSYIKLHVHCMPAMFWTVEIYCDGSEEVHNLETGSGALSDFWDTFELFATGMIGAI